MKIGGIAGEAINGSVVYGCSVIAKIYVRENVGYKITCIGGIVGMIEEEGAFDDPMEATVVQECMVEATNTSTSNFLTIIGSLAQHIKKDSDTGIEGDSSVSNCYYRIGNDTYYLFSMNSKTENSMEDSSNISYSFDANIWFRLPNGWWTLRVFYWT